MPARLSFSHRPARSGGASAPPPFSFRLWQAASWLVGIALPLLLWQRRRRGREDPERQAERFGISSAVRPPGLVIWIQAVSVGEAMSVLGLIPHLTQNAPWPHILLTTSTTSSAQLVSSYRLAHSTHQFTPWDHPRAVRRFLEHWQPNLAVFVESELWPNLLGGLRRQRIKHVLLNARISERSARRWQKAPRLIAWLLQGFDAILAQDEIAQARLAALGAPRVRIGGNLKWDAPPLPADEAALAALTRLLGARPRWLAASMHPGEEEPIAAAHSVAQSHYAGLVTIVVPRHPTRGAEIKARFEALGLRVAQRSQGEPLAAATQIYLADTIGELGLLYRAAPLVFLGGSLVAHGGQNPLEAARLDCAILHGSHVSNFSTIYAQLHAAKAALQIDHADELSNAVSWLLAAKGAGMKARRRMAEAAAKLAAAQHGITTTTAQFLRARLPAPPPDSPS